MIYLTLTGFCGREFLEDHLAQLYKEVQCELGNYLNTYSKEGNCSTSKKYVITPVGSRKV